jgi:hypothetical protein
MQVHETCPNVVVLSVQVNRLGAVQRVVLGQCNVAAQVREAVAYARDNITAVASLVIFGAHDVVHRLHEDNHTSDDLIPLLKARFSGVLQPTIDVIPVELLLLL